MAQATEENFKIEHSREHLANERTFLAWIRTSLGIIGLGFVVVKFTKRPSGAFCKAVSINRTC